MGKSQYNDIVMWCSDKPCSHSYLLCGGGVYHQGEV